MLKESFRVFQRFYLLLDAICVALAWVIAYWVRFHADWIPVYYGVPSFRAYLVHLPLVLLVWIAALTYGGAYRADRWWNVTKEWKPLVRSSAFAMVLLVSVTYLSTKAEFSRVFYALFLSLATLGLLTTRWIFRALIRRSRKNGSSLKRVLVVGENAFAAPFCMNIDRHPEIGLMVWGQLLAEDRRKTDGHKNVLGNYSAIRETVKEEQIDIVVFALPLEEARQSKELLRSIDDLAVDIHLIPDVSPIMQLRPGVEDFKGIPMIQVRASPQQGIARLEKRLFDVVLTGLAMIVLAPAYLIIATLIKATSPGPVLYRQPRLGTDGRVFSLVKFRTMEKGAEMEDRPVWSMRHDPRRTRLGAFLRKYSLDELPQFWNVLKGDMSLVGPRPERPEFIEEFQKQIPSYILRQKVKSGLTGLAQVRGWRGATSLEKRVECDIQYIEGWSLGLDLKILFLTVWKGFINKAEQ